MVSLRDIECAYQIAFGKREKAYTRRIASGVFRVGIGDMFVQWSIHDQSAETAYSDLISAIMRHK